RVDARAHRSRARLARGRGRSRRADDRDRSDEDGERASRGPRGQSRRSPGPSGRHGGRRSEAHPARMKRLGTADVLALVRAGAFLLVAGVVLRALEWVFSSRPIVAVVVGAFSLDLWAQRIDARWTAPAPARPDRVLTFVVAAGTGLGLGLFVVLAASALG